MSHYVDTETEIRLILIDKNIYLDFFFYIQQIIVTKWKLNEMYRKNNLQECYQEFIEMIKFYIP